MNKALLHLPLGSEVYKIMRLACHKRGYKIISVDNEAGIIMAQKRVFVLWRKNLLIHLVRADHNITKIEVSIKRNNIVDSTEEERIISTIYKYC